MPNEMTLRQDLGKGFGASVGLASPDGNVRHNHALGDNNEKCWCRFSTVKPMVQLGADYTNGRFSTSATAFSSHTAAKFEAGADVDLSGLLGGKPSAGIHYYAGSDGTVIINGQYEQNLGGGRASVVGGHRGNKDGDAGWFFSGFWKMVVG